MDIVVIVLSIVLFISLTIFIIGTEISTAKKIKAIEKEQNVILINKEEDNESEEESIDTNSILQEYLDKQNLITETKETGILEKLMGYDNERLRKIVTSPRLYNPVVVEKAGKLLARREAWEEIKDMPDEELLEMTMADKGLYDENVVEAASMELYQRGSEVLRGQFMTLTPDVVATIADGTAPAPEGIRLAAKDFLDKHLRR